MNDDGFATTLWASIARLSDSIDNGKLPAVHQVINMGDCLSAASGESARGSIGPAWVKWASYY